MIQEQARVTSIQGARAIIEVQRRSACSGCNLTASCGTGSLGRLLGFRQKPIIINNDMNLKPGDRVLVSLPEHSFVQAGLLIYLLPLLAMFAFALLAEVVLGLGDGITMLAGLVGLACGLYFSAWLARHPLLKTMQPSVARHIQ